MDCPLLGNILGEKWEAIFVRYKIVQESVRVENSHSRSAGKTKTDNNGYSDIRADYVNLHCFIGLSTSSTHTNTEGGAHDFKMYCVDLPKSLG